MKCEKKAVRLFIRIHAQQKGIAQKMLMETNQKFSRNDRSWKSHMHWLLVKICTVMLSSVEESIHIFVAERSGNEPNRKIDT